MALVNAKCPNCGGILKVDNTTDALICSYCDSPFITEKAINNYNTTHNHFTINVYNMYGGNSADFVIRSDVLEKYNGASTKVKIPNIVTHIRGAFKDCSGLISVEIPNSVQEIGQNAFSGCKNLTSITIPENVEEIGNNAFAGCKSLTSIEIPEKVEEIGDNAFAGCKNLTYVELPENVKKINSFTFAGCENLDSVEIPEVVEEIGPFAFAGCENLYSIEIPDSVKKIGDNAFTECKELYSVVIPSDIEEIGDNIFKNCSKLTEVYFDKVNENRQAFPEDFLKLYDTRTSNGQCAYCGGNFNILTSAISQIFNFRFINVKCNNCGNTKNY